MTNQDSFFHKVGELENLTKRQQKALEMASELLDMKDKLIALCEEETELYKKENKRLRRSLIISEIIFVVLAVLNLTRLLL
jgi:hypothetical protein